MNAKSFKLLSKNFSCKICFDAEGILITVKLADGSSKIVLIGASTAVSKTAEVSKDDLKTGARVGVFGTENADGTLNAHDIQ